jgi:hypothetical protein
MGNIRILLKHGTDAEVNAYTGTAGELVVKDNTADVRIIDGSTPGGKPFDGVTYSAGTVSLGSPINGATNVAVQPALVGSSFNGDGTLAASYWQIARDAGFTDLVHDSGRIAGASVTYNPGVTLDYLTTYYARVKYESSTGVQTDWSTPVSFTTKEHVLTGNVIQTIFRPDSYGTPWFGYDGLDMTADGQTFVAVQKVTGANQKIQIYNWNGTQYGYVGGIQDVMSTYLGSVLAISNDGNFIAASYDNMIRLYTNVSGTWAIVGTYSETNFHGYGKLEFNAASNELYALKTSNGSLMRFTFDTVSFNLAETISPPSGYTFREQMRLSSDGNKMIASLLKTSGPHNNPIAYLTRSGGTWSIDTVIGIASISYGGPVDALRMSDDGSIVVLSYATHNVNDGKVVVLKWNGSAYTEVASYTSVASGEYAGEALALSSDGTKVAVSRRPGNIPVVSIFNYNPSNNAFGIVLTTVDPMALTSTRLVEMKSDGLRMVTGKDSANLYVFE